jgi:CTP:molybdopterin cytidylyltransferase MocA
MSDATPTLLIFTLGPRVESERRHLLPGQLRGVEQRLHRACLDSVVGAGYEAGCRVEVSSPQPLTLPPGVVRSPQQGHDFGGRLVSAVRQAARHDGPLLLVGGDVPELRARHLTQALERLRGNPRRVVLGPSPDGGFYLLAAASPIDHLLESVPWCRTDTLVHLTRRLAEAGFEVELLEPLADLDRPVDLGRLLRGSTAHLSRRWRALLDQLREQLAALAAPVAPSRLGRPRPATVPVRTGRAPPLRPSRR